MIFHTVKFSEGHETLLDETSEVEETLKERFWKTVSLLKSFLMSSEFPSLAQILHKKKNKWGLQLKKSSQLKKI